MSQNMRRDFANRADLLDYLRQQFPRAAQENPNASEIIGGYSQAERLKKQINPMRYEKTRNYLSGAVTRLSPYIRHGVLSLAELRRYALALVEHSRYAEKFINELAWRNYWQLIYKAIGEAIWRDQEPYKTGYSAELYADTLPNDIRHGTTGLACIDAFSHQLSATGYLHNHARMWLASYIVHFRRVRWQAGARWFLEHLLDGDPASNNLSWQWVASTFSHKPYFFNRENLERYTNGVYCRSCPLYGRCTFEGSYEAIEKRLFPNMKPRPK